MKKKLVTSLVTGLLVCGMAGMAQATLTTIGTATYNSSDYNLIWDDDNNGNSVVWLDYTNHHNNSTNWAAHNTWATGLDAFLTYNIDPGFTVDWGTNTWRLPSAGANPQQGFNNTSSEMGHLFLDELGFLPGSFSSWETATTADLQATIFDNLINRVYWTSTEADPNVYGSTPLYHWDFWMDSSFEQAASVSLVLNGIAVRTGQVSVVNSGPGPSPVPEPATMLLLGTGIAGIAGLKRRKNG